MTDEVNKPKKIGRPKKDKLPVGRPKGQEAIMKDYRMRMLNSPKSRKVLDSVFEVATDPEHKHFAACSKLILDRIAPTTGFTDMKTGESRPTIQVNITGVTGVDTKNDSSFGAADIEAEDGDWKTLDE